MNIFGVGPLELVLVLVFAILVLGPEGMVKAGRVLGKNLRKLYNSEFWRAMRGSDDLLEKLSRDVGIDEDLEEIREELSQVRISQQNGVQPKTPPPEPRSDQAVENQGEEESDIDQENITTEDSPGRESNGNNEEKGT